MNVLVATDGSKYGQWGLNWVAKLPFVEPPRVTVLHVLDGAAFTVQEVNGHVLLNASESRDPNGLSLTYKWWEDETELSTTAQQYETGPLVSKSSHTFKLEVTDSGGLSNATSHTVEMK